MSWRSLLKFVGPYRFQLLFVGLLATGVSLVTLTLPWLASQLIGGIIEPDSGGMKRLVALLLLALCAIAFLNFGVASISGTTSNRLLADLRLRIYEHLQALPIGFHDNHRQGDTLALMTYEVARLSSFLTSTLTSIPSRLLTAAGAVLLMFRIDPKLALLVPLLLPAFYIILKLIGRRLRGLAQSIQQAEAEVVAIAEENLEMLPAIKAFTRENAETRRYAGQVERAMNLTLKASRINAALEPAIGLAAASGAILLLYLASEKLQSGATTTTGLLSFLFYAALLSRPIGSLANVYGQVQSARGTLERLEGVLDQPIEQGYTAAERMDKAKGNISFREVRFGYPDRTETLRGVNFEIRSGEIIAFTGKNGAGKSTLIQLLLRFYEPLSGEIYLDGRNTGTLDIRELRRQFGLVSQRTLLFNGTIRANIAYGLEKEASRQAIETAACLAQAHNFIVELPQGYDTVIGDHGVRLSGGQRQRIALARALIKDPPILVLDEATSMYDLEGESAFVAAFSTAFKGRTVILVSHRPASLALAQRILTVNDGLVTEASPNSVLTDERKI